MLFALSRTNRKSFVIDVVVVVEIDLIRLTLPFGSPCLKPDHYQIQYFKMLGLPKNIDLNRVQCTYRDDILSVSFIKVTGARDIRVLSISDTDSETNC